MSFIRRFTYDPGPDVIGQIEGVTILDLMNPPGVQGAGTGVVACVGEFADMTYATAVGSVVGSSAGKVSTSVAPVEVYTAQDMQEKVGGFDSTLGNFGTYGGNGYVGLYGKKFARLVIAPVNLACDRACRLWRDLPTNRSATNPTPITPMQAAVVEAGKEFKSGANRVRTAKRFVFANTNHYYSAVDGGTPAAAGATCVLTSVLSDFVARGVQVGDIVVLGSLAATVDNLLTAGTYRVTVVAPGADPTKLTLEKLDGSNFAFAAPYTALAFRIHAAATADSGGAFARGSAAYCGGYAIPVRTLDASVANNLALLPTVAMPAGTATTWDPLSGLYLATMPNAADGLTFRTNAQAANATSHADIDAEYQSAITALLADATPTNEVNIVFACRSSLSAAANPVSLQLDNFEGAASARGIGRMVVWSPPLSTVTLSTVVGNAAPGVGVYRDERNIYSWPGAQVYVDTAVGASIKRADGTTTTNGYIDVPADGWMASVLSVLAPERNPGQQSPPVTDVLAPILGLQLGLATPLTIDDYITLRAYGVAALRIDKSVGPVFQSGITTSLTTGQKNIARRRMADYIEDSISVALTKFLKLPLTAELKKTILGEISAYLEGLLSAQNPAQQRILAYSVDGKSGNTKAAEAAGIYVVQIRVQTLASADFIVLSATIGETVQVTVS